MTVAWGIFPEDLSGREMSGFFIIVYVMSVVFCFFVLLSLLQKAVDYGVELRFSFFFFFCSYAFKNLSVFGRKQSLVCIVFQLLLEDRSVSGFLLA